MNDLQEAIVDHLMVVEKIGTTWRTGPVGLAVAALEARGMFGRHDATQTLGFPLILCRALQGANTGLKPLDDRRKLALSFFSEVAPRQGSVKLRSTRQIQAALWGAQRAHSFVCCSECPFAVALANWVRDWLTNGWLLAGRPQPDDCVSVDRIDSASEVRPQSLRSVLGAFRYTCQAAECVGNGRWPGENSGRALRDAAEATALVKGVGGAIDFCLALAQRVGLKS